MGRERKVNHGIADMIHKSECYKDFGFRWLRTPLRVDSYKWSQECQDDMLILFDTDDDSKTFLIYGYAETKEELVAIRLFDTRHKYGIAGYAKPGDFAPMEQDDYVMLVNAGCMDGNDSILHRMLCNEFPFDINVWKEEHALSQTFRDHWPEEPLPHITKGNYHVFDAPFLVPKEMWEENHPDCVFLGEEINEETYKVYAYAEEDDSLKMFDKWNSSAVYPHVWRITCGMVSDYVSRG